jgi:hypothetical protein
MKAKKDNKMYSRIEHSLQKVRGTEPDPSSPHNAGIIENPSENPSENPENPSENPENPENLEAVCYSLV